MNDLQTRGLAIVAEISERPAAELEARHELVGDLGIDSPKALQMLLRLEDELKIEISDEEAARLDTVGDVLAFLERQG
ncbi:MAG: acyl carrier protein [Acidobacteriota bacterium]